jgi:holin-like protein
MPEAVALQAVRWRSPAAFVSAQLSSQRKAHLLPPPFRRQGAGRICVTFPIDISRRPQAVTETSMPAALFILIGCQLIGEVLRAGLHLPVPGPVIGMFLLAAVLAGRRSGTPGDTPAPSPLQRTADALISHMGLLFVPAGVGVIAQAGLLRTQWFPIVAALAGSTILSLIVTGLTMHWTGRTAAAPEPAPPIHPPIDPASFEEIPS